MPMIISHLTDVEGNWRYFQQWANRSQTLQLTNGQLSFRHPQVLNAFVYGGDSCDKGPGDIRIVRALTQLKAQHPEHVTLIAGNREIKYRRFTTPQASNTSYLKWMLAETMGCGSMYGKPDTFEYRRMELAELTNTPRASISDHEVTQSFIDSVSPNGWMTRYLQSAQLGKIIGETLFIHGAVTPDNIGYVPGRAKTITRADDWIEALNTWYLEQIKEWQTQSVDDRVHLLKHKPLDQYVIANPKSIVTTNWYTQGKLAPIRDEVVRFLNASGIYRVVSGHQPFSDFPLVIRQPNLEVIVGDTAYSDSTAEADCRGLALHNLDIVQFNGHGYATIEAIRADGSACSVTLPSKAQCMLGQDTHLGHFTARSRLIRPGIATPFITSQLDGYIIHDEPLPRDVLSMK